MIALVYSTADPASMNIAEQLKELHGLIETDALTSHPPELILYKVDVPLVDADFLDELEADLIIFLCRHSSAGEVPALTVHSAGNWGDETKLGGKPRSLSVAAPSVMLSILSNMNKSRLEMEKTYEATHHGPYLNTPSVFAEMGGRKDILENTDTAAVVADSVYKAAVNQINFNLHYKKIVLGIGGGHYPRKFTQLALEKGYAFSHIMPKYSIINDDVDNIDMLDQAVARSSEKPEVAVVEWKSLRSGVRQKIIGKLGSLGIDYEKV